MPKPTLPSILPFPRRVRRSVAGAILLFVLVGCDDPITNGGDPSPTVAVGVVVNSTELSLTVFPLEEPDASWTVPLGPDGSPVGAAVRGDVAVVPMGIVPTAVVVDLAAGSVLHTVSLPEGSGATGAAFVNDSIVLVANPDRNTVSPVNVRTGTAGPEIAVGRYPAGVRTIGEVVWVLNGELEDFQPAGPGTFTLLDRETFEELGTVELSGENPGGMALGPGGLLYVVHGGTWGEGNGSLSVVDTHFRAEAAHHPGFGDFPQQPAYAGDERIYVSSWSYGLVAWDPFLNTFHRGPDDPIAPDGVGAAAGVAVDPSGALWSLFPDCTGPSSVLRLSASYEVEERVDVGICPAALYFTELEDLEGASGG